MHLQSEFSQFHTKDFYPDNILLRILWSFFRIIFFKSSCLPFTFIKVFRLRIFGDKIGKSVVIKPSVNIKYPWKLS